MRFLLLPMALAAGCVNAAQGAYPDSGARVD